MTKVGILCKVLCFYALGERDLAIIQCPFISRHWEHAILYIPYFRWKKWRSCGLTNMLNITVSSWQSRVANPGVLNRSKNLFTLYNTSNIKLGTQNQSKINCANSILRSEQPCTVMGTVQNPTLASCHLCCLWKWVPQSCTRRFWLWNCHYMNTLSILILHFVT